jgi:hypothetical protein
MTRERIIYGNRKDIKVEDERFPEWALKSQYAEELWEMFNSNLSDQVEIIRCQDCLNAGQFRRLLTKRAEALRSL